MKKYKYDVALSYASEDLNLVKRVYRILICEGLKVFFAPEYQHSLVGEDADSRFYEIFKKECMFVTSFVSRYYISKDVPMFEARIAMNRNKNEARKCLIPIYLDKDVSLSGLDEKIIYFPEKNEVEIADLIIKKIRNSNQSNNEIPIVSFSVSANVVTATFSKPVYSTNSGSGALDESDFVVSASNGSITHKVSHTAGSKTATITITYGGLSTGDASATAITLYSNSAFDVAGNVCPQRSHNFTYTAP